MRSVAATLLLCLLPTAALAEDPVEVLRLTNQALQVVGPRLRDPASTATQRATAERALEELHGRYRWVLDHRAEFPKAERAEAVQLAHYNSGCIRALQGRQREALDALERAIDAGYSNASGMKQDPDLATLRDLARFRWLTGSLLLDSALTNEFILAVQMRTALSAEPPDLEAVRLRASLLLEAGTSLRASSLSQRTLHARLNLMLASVYAQRGDSARALDHAVRALETGMIDPTATTEELRTLSETPRFLEAAGEQAKRWAPAKPQPLELDWTWTFSDDLDAAAFEAQAQVARGWARTLWRVSEGNVRLARLTLRDRAVKAGEVHTPRSTVRQRMLSANTYAMTLNGVLLTPGRVGAFTFVHEVGHLLFWLPEEYDSPTGCPCVQAGERGRLVWCDSSTHSPEQAKLGKPDCWSTILKRYPGLRHPGPGGALPAIDVVVDNR